MSEEKGFVYGGIRFRDEATAHRAEEETKRILALDANINYENPKAVLSLYQKALANNVFQTPVGIAYMLKLRNDLINAGFPAGSIPPLELPEPPAVSAVPKEEVPAPKQDTIPKEEIGGSDGAGTIHGARLEARLEAQKQVSQRQIDLIKKQWMIMAALVLIILSMFVIAMTGNNPTILNYRSKILNQYSEWEKELEEREAAISQKEKAAGVALEGSETFKEGQTE